MPYPNEHSCRLRDPGDFQADSFRRMSRESDGKRYDAIMGRLKGEDTMTDQAYRYPKDTWTEAEARKHCKEHDGILFEPASEGANEGDLFGEECCGGNEGQDTAANRHRSIPKKGYRMDKSYVLRAFIETPWAILPHRLAVLEEIVIRHVAGEKLDAEEVETRIHGAKRPAERRVGSVAVLPLFGTIFPRANMMTDVSGATSAEQFGNQFMELVKDPEIGAIVLDVNSPGGNVLGIDEVSQKIYKARGQKPVIAVANHLMASAAYWIGTAADEIVISPSGEVGSIGVFSVHEDISKALEQDGIKLTLISKGKYKVEGNPYEPLGTEAQAAIQERVSEYYDAFIKSVARNRGVKPAQVRNGFGEGRVVGARQAIDLFMADRVGTLEETINRLLMPGPGAVTAGQAEEAAPVLDEGMQREAENLREKVESILHKEKNRE